MVTTINEAALQRAEILADALDAKANSLVSERYAPSWVKSISTSAEMLRDLTLHIRTKSNADIKARTGRCPRCGARVEPIGDSSVIACSRRKKCGWSAATI